MLFDTVAAYDAEIAEVQGYLKKSMKEQATVSGGPGQGMHSQRGAVRDIREYLQLLSNEREILRNRQGVAVVQAVFRREN